MRSILSIVVAATLVATSHQPLGAQSGPRQLPASVQVGDRVRFWVPEVLVATYGVLAAWTADSFAIDETWHLMESVTRLQVTRRPSSDEVSSATYVGGFIGAAAGLAYVAPCYIFPCRKKDLWKYWVAAAVLGAVTAGLRKSRETRWEDVPLHHLTLSPLRKGGFGIGVRLVF
ncbi:MAG: hypothetical protein O7F70_06680 [Gemmatimonadetes bacterium]|nr:hypothetical protein [Gemmatimonadota bacterium]